VNVPPTGNQITAVGKAHISAVPHKSQHSVIFLLTFIVLHLCSYVSL